MTYEEACTHTRLRTEEVQAIGFSAAVVKRKERLLESGWTSEELGEEARRRMKVFIEKKRAQEREESLRKSGTTTVDPIWTVTVRESDVPTVCKHKAGTCDKCGTNTDTDRRHKTVGGRGLVAQLRDKDRKGKRR